MQVRNTVAADAKPSFSEQVHRFFDVFVPAEAMLVTARGVGVFFLLVGSVFGGGLVSAQAYRNAVPGGLSYSIKTAIEAAQLALAPNDEYRTRLHTEFADRRMDEVSQLAEGGAAGQAHIAATLTAFNKEVIALGLGLDELKDVETAKLLERKMAVYKNGLRKTAALLPVGNGRALASSRSTVDSVSIKAMAIIVEHHLAGDELAPKSVVAAKFEDRIKDAEAAATTTQAKAAVAATKALIKEGNYQAALSKITEIAELKKEEDEAAAVKEEAEAVTPAPGEEPSAELKAAEPVTEATPTTSQ